ncbi:N-acetylneuraminate synthase family protein [Kordiimonas sp.]|uniref:N-acetylneuraminate synthase family protein n=1 Tax=Kordiimonas sp. TaxID=1970157 RepID=UPI003A921077
MASRTFFISEASSNHARNLDRCLQFVDVSADIGCDAVKFQLFRIDELFAPEILAKSETHRARSQWELPEEFLAPIAARCRDRNIKFSCTPFFLDAVEILAPHVDFFKIASYELPWTALIEACAKTGKPLVLSTGMATLEEVMAAADTFRHAGGRELTLLHCVSGYPVAPEFCNLGAIETIRDATGYPVGWSDHSRDPAVVGRAIDRWRASTIEFHLDLDAEGAEYQTGHCWLPEEIAPLIAGRRRLEVGVDGTGIKEPTEAERADRPWRADPTDGLRPTLAVREEWRIK